MEPILNREAIAHGVTREQLRSPAWSHPAAGVSVAVAPAPDLEDVCRAVALVLPPDGVFTHLTAGQLRGWWLPDFHSSPLIACSDSDAPHLDRRGVYVRRCAIPESHRAYLHGIRIASPEWTIIELAEHLSLIDLVAVIDSALHLGHTTIERIWAAVVPGRRGVRVLRQALGLCDGRSESRWESILRLLYVLSGISVLPQHELFDASGSFVARADLLIVGTRRISEYDGANHRDMSRHRSDLRREKAIARLGLERFGYASPEILHSADLIIRDAEDALGLAHDPGRLKVWSAEYARSSLSPAGMRQLDIRLARFSRDAAPRAHTPTQPTSGAKSGPSSA